MVGGWPQKPRERQRKNLMCSAVQCVRTVVVDDSSTFLRSLCSFLRDFATVQVVGAADSAREAFAVVEQVKPDLVLIDLQMPGMNGLEATTVLRSRYPDTQVILVTMHDTPELRQASLEGGAFGFVSKGRLGQDLPSVLERVVATFKH